mgnify:CR=1 FL=1
MERQQLINYHQVEICRNEQVVLQKADFELYSGEFVYLIGRVGSGKSTLLKTIYAEVPIQKGEATVFDLNMRKIRRRSIPSLRRRLGIVFQDFQLLTDRSVQKNLEFVLRATGWKDKKEIAERIENILRKVGMENKAYRMPHELSGGEQQRIVIARALLNSPQIILADEPTGNLDPQTGKQIVALLHEICNEGTAVVMTTHNHYLVKEFPGRVLLCNEKQITDITDTIPTTK